MGILSSIKHLAPLTLYLTAIFFFLRGLAGDGRWALLLVTFLIPLRNILDKLQDFPRGNQIVDILIMGAFIGCLVFSSKEKKKFPGQSSLNIIIIIMVIYTFISVLLGSNYLYHTFFINFSEDRFRDWKNFCLLPLLFFITFNHITDRKWIIRVLVVMGFGMFIMNYYTVDQIREYSNLVSREKIRGTFQFLGTNEVAAFYNEYTIILMGIVFFVKRKWIRWTLYVIILVNIFCILNLYSRGAYLGLFAGLCVLFMFKNRKFLILPILLALFWQSILPANVIVRIKQTTDENGQLDESSQRRIDIWKYSLGLFQKSPLTGIGYGVFRDLGLDLGDTHNIYVKYLVEQGLIGFTIFIVLLFCFLRMGYVLYKKGEDDLCKGMGLGVMACIIVVIVNNLFGDRWTYLEISANLWIFAGLVARLIVMPPEKPEPMPEVKQKVKIPTTALIEEKKKKKIRYYDM